MPGKEPGKTGPIMDIEIIHLAFSGLYGAIIGSFLNVVIYRLPRGESLLIPPSHCRSCNQWIRWYDNIPLISYLLLGGKCRSCKGRIPIRYPLVELLTGLCFMLLYAADILGEFGKPSNYGVFALHCALFAALIAITFIDFDYRIIPNSISVGGGVIALLLSAAFPGLMYPIPYWLSGMESHAAGLISSLIGGAAGAGLTLAMALLGRLVFRKEAMGMGDVKLMAMFGALLGWQASLIIFFTAPFLGIIVGLPRKWITGDSYLAYGPFLAIACAGYVFLEPLIQRLLFPLF
jgi:leader peptidase (prepilin peptidase)/N-methyltransferase